MPRMRRQSHRARMVNARIRRENQRQNQDDHQYAVCFDQTMESLEWQTCTNCHRSWPNLKLNSASKCSNCSTPAKQTDYTDFNDMDPGEVPKLTSSSPHRPSPSGDIVIPNTRGTVRLFWKSDKFQTGRDDLIQLPTSRTLRNDCNRSWIEKDAKRFRPIQGKSERCQGCTHMAQKQSSLSQSH